MQGTTRATRRALAAVATLGMALAGVGLAGSPAGADLQPVDNTVTVKAGETVTEDKLVTIPEFPAKADIEIAIDTTGSMTDALDQAKAQAKDLVQAVQAEIPDANFAVVQFNDITDELEYAVQQPMTSDGDAVQTAIDDLALYYGGDFPEAYNVVFDRAADPVSAGEIGWRDDARKFVVVIGDAPPHMAAESPSAAAYPSCLQYNSPDPHDLQTFDELAALKAAERTLFMVYANDWNNVPNCYAELAADGFAGSQAAALGTDLASQIVQLIGDASSSVDEVHLEVVSAGPAPADASWVDFAPASAVGPFQTGAEIPFTVSVTPPETTPPGEYKFSIQAIADGGNIGTQRLTVIVEEAFEPIETKLRAHAAVAEVLHDDDRWLVESEPNQVHLKLHATLTEAETGAPVVGEWVRFEIEGNWACKALTDADGVARCKDLLQVPRAVVGLDYVAIFDGTETHLPSRNRGPIVWALKTRVELK